MLISVFELFLLAGLGFIALFWWHGTLARTTAIDGARAWCLSYGWQLLDETVTLRRMRPMRLTHGALGLQRIYDFEYSDTGNNRIAAWLIMEGTMILAVEHHPFQVLSPPFSEPPDSYTNDH